MSLMRVRTEFAGFAGAPGLMTQYFSTALAVPNASLAQLAVDRVRDAMLTSPTLWPTSFTWRVQGQVDVLEEANGQLVDSINVTERSGAGTTTSGVGYGPLPVGICVTWLTQEFKAGRRVTGRTFLVPLAANAFETNGTLTSTAIVAAQAWGDAMNNPGTNDLVLVVWSRPGTGVGTKHGVVGNRIADKAAVLRSRRQ